MRKKASTSTSAHVSLSQYLEGRRGKEREEKRRRGKKREGEGRRGKKSEGERSRGKEKEVKKMNASIE